MKGKIVQKYFYMLPSQDKTKLNQPSQGNFLSTPHPFLDPSDLNGIPSYQYGE